MVKVRSFGVGESEVVVGGDQLVLIAGPCVIESEAHARTMAESIAEIAAELRIPYVYKASFDKANRSSASSPRGPGEAEGLGILRRIRDELAVPVLTDVHTEAQVVRAAEHVDILQIPAFLCRQTDLLLAAGATGKPVNIKKGQFMAPWDMGNVVKKVQSTGNRAVALTERGTSFGYNTLVSDLRSLPQMRSCGVPVIYDATHSVQQPGGQGNASGGDREMAIVLARAAAAVGIDGLFLEVHDNPDHALSDGPNMIHLTRLREVLQEVKAIDGVVRQHPGA